jgi:hypothetical protein
MKLIIYIFILANLQIIYKEYGYNYKGTVTLLYSWYKFQFTTYITLLI